MTSASVPTVTGRPVQPPVGIPVDSSAAVREELSRAKSRFREDLQDIERRRRSEFEASLNLATGLAQARVGEAVQNSINSRLPQALRAHLHDHDATRRLVAEVSGSLQRRVEADAASVVARLASKEVAERQLSAALERRCMQRVDERMGSLWTAYFLGGAVTAATVGIVALSRR